MDTAKKSYPVSAYLKFIIFPLIGIFAFFINFPLREYTVMGWTVARNSTFLVSHLTALLKALLWDGSFKIMPYVVLAIAAYGLIDLIIRRKKHFSNSVNKTFSIMRVVGCVFLVFMVFNVGPAVMHEARDTLNGSSIASFVLNGVLITICISIPLSAIFLPFLLNYGLVESVGVLVRPLMRPLFNLPGRSAIILVTASLSNFSVAHLAVDDQYANGNMTEREAITIATCFCSSSIAFMMMLSRNSRITDHWNAYFWSVILITILISLVGARIFPLSKISDDYAPGATPHPEIVYKQDLFKNSLDEGLTVSQAAQNPVRGIGRILLGTLALLASIVMGAGFSSSVGMLLYFYTPIFEWIGIIFRPLMWLVQMPGTKEAVQASTGTAISLLEVTIPSLLVSAGDWSPHIRYMMAAVPMTSVIFLGSFVPSILGTNLPVKFWHMMIIWVERMILSVILTGLFALMLFGIPT